MRIAMDANKMRYLTFLTEIILIQLSFRFAFFLSKQLIICWILNRMKRKHNFFWNRKGFKSLGHTTNKIEIEGEKKFSILLVWLLIWIKFNNKIKLYYIKNKSQKKQLNTIFLSLSWNNLFGQLLNRRRCVETLGRIHAKLLIVLVFRVDFCLFN